jgi:hypothetical protein
MPCDPDWTTFNGHQAWLSLFVGVKYSPITYLLVSTLQYVIEMCITNEFSNHFQIFAETQIM